MPLTVASDVNKSSHNGEDSTTTCFSDTTTLQHPQPQVSKKSLVVAREVNISAHIVEDSTTTYIAETTTLQHPAGTNGFNAEEHRKNGHRGRLIAQAKSKSSAGQLSFRVKNLLKETFLPVGYPESVRPEYDTYQTWDTLQALSSYLRGVLATTAWLDASGVGDANASALALAIVWVLQDGFGMVGGLLFSYGVGSGMDANIKAWRLFADVINDVGLTLDMVAPYYRKGFSIITSLAYMCKALCGVAAGCTKTSITSHFATRANMADIASKENAQETAVTLLGMMMGIQVAKYLADSPLLSWAIFLGLTLMHIYANYKCVSSLHLDTLNKQRAALLIRSYTKGQEDRLDGVDMTQALTPQAVSKQETICRSLFLCGQKLGCRLSVACQDHEQLRWLAEHFGDDRYLLTVNKSSEVCVVVHRQAAPEHMLQSYFHYTTITYWRSTRHRGNGGEKKGKFEREAEDRALVLESLQYTRTHFPGFLEAVKAAGWDVQHLLLGYGSWRCDWDLKND